MMTIRETWRAAALRDQLQFFCDVYGTVVAYSRARHRYGRAYEFSACGLTVLPRALKEPLYETICDTVRCPDCGMDGGILWLIPHLNDVHLWSWLDLASKFPPVLPEDNLFPPEAARDGLLP